MVTRRLSFEPVDEVFDATSRGAIQGGFKFALIVARRPAMRSIGADDNSAIVQDRSLLITQPAQVTASRKIRFESAQPPRRANPPFAQVVHLTYHKLNLTLMNYYKIILT